MAKSEILLYKPISVWLNNLLISHFPQSGVLVYDSHAKTLSSIIERKGFQRFFPNYQVFDIKVDITAFIQSKNRMDLVFVEVKDVEIKLTDVGQILGYSRVAKPYLSMILAPEGLSVPLESIIKTYGRYDVLEYDGPKRIKIAKWNTKRREIDFSSIIPEGDLLD